MFVILLIASIHTTFIQMKENNKLAHESSSFVSFFLSLFFHAHTEDNRRVIISSWPNGSMVHLSHSDYCVDTCSLAQFVLSLSHFPSTPSLSRTFVCVASVLFVCFHRCNRQRHNIFHPYKNAALLHMTLSNIAQGYFTVGHSFFIRLRPFDCVKGHHQCPRSSLKVGTLLFWLCLLRLVFIVQFAFTCTPYIRYSVCSHTVQCPRLSQREWQNVYDQWFHFMGSHLVRSLTVCVTLTFLFSHPNTKYWKEKSFSNFVSLFSLFNLNYIFSYSSPSLQFSILTAYYCWFVASVLCCYFSFYSLYKVVCVCFVLCSYILSPTIVFVVLFQIWFCKRWEKTQKWYTGSGIRCYVLCVSFIWVYYVCVYVTKCFVIWLPHNVGHSATPSALINAALTLSLNFVALFLLSSFSLLGYIAQFMPAFFFPVHLSCALLHQLTYEWENMKLNT